MPARFVEVANLANAARNSDAMGYLPHLSFNSSSFNTYLHTWAPPENATNTSTTAAVRRALLLAAQNARPPAGAARALISMAVLLIVVRCVLVRLAARRALRSYGHAHDD